MAAVLAVMLYGLETWVMTPCIKRFLGGFHHRVALRLTGRQPRIGQESEYLYTLLLDAMAEVGLQEVLTYIPHNYNTVTQFIVTRPIMDLCLAAERGPGSRVAKWWWDKDGLELEGMGTVA